jgi:hypothetical protein
MTRRKANPPSAGDLEPAEASEVLMRLAARRDAVGEAVRAEIAAFLERVDVEEVAGGVLFDLEAIDLEEIWSRSGRHHFGYTDPLEAADKLAQEALRARVERIAWYHQRGNLAACDAQTLGILRGIYDCAHEGEIDWTDHFPDLMLDTFQSVQCEWEKLRRDAKAKQALRTQIERHCPKWSLAPIPFT